MVLSRAWPSIVLQGSVERIGPCRCEFMGTSSECSVCGDRMVFSKESRMLHCPTCGVHVDRDVNAARNICSAGLRFSLLGLSSEALKGNPPTMVIPGVDDSQPSPTMLNTEQPKT